MRSIKKIIHFIKRCIQFIYYSLFKQGRFDFNGKVYPYHYSLWNVTFSNERAIEVPIAIDLLKQYKGQMILEVGNVMHWYYKSNHHIVDKYERGKNIASVDIVDYISPKYDLILSVSTLEHVGYDEVPHDSEKIYKAIEKMKSLLFFGGLLFVTIPVGQNPTIDMDRFEKQFSKTHRLKWENGYEICIGYYCI